MVHLLYETFSSFLESVVSRMGLDLLSLRSIQTAQAEKMAEFIEILLIC